MREIKLAGPKMLNQMARSSVEDEDSGAPNGTAAENLVRRERQSIPDASRPVEDKEATEVVDGQARHLKEEIGKFVEKGATKY